MTLTLEKVLAKSMKEYCDDKGVSKSDYTTKLLSFPLNYSGSDLNKLNIANLDVNPKEELIKLAPEHTEAIVRFEIKPYGKKDWEVYGTALIPKKQ